MPMPKSIASPYNRTTTSFWAAGYFTSRAGQPRNQFGRLNANTAPTQLLSFDGSTINWTRGGSSPETWRTSFEASTNGNGWFPLGAGNRVSGGWQLAGLNL